MTSKRCFGSFASDVLSALAVAPQDGQTRLEDRVAALHTSLETMLEDLMLTYLTL